MKNTPETWRDIKEILLNQLTLIKQESDRTPDKLPELTEAMCKIISELSKLSLNAR